MGCSICGQQQEGAPTFAGKIKNKTIGNGEDFEPKGMFSEKLTGDPLQQFELEHFPFGTLLSEVYEREIDKIKEEHEDYEEPFVTIGAMKKAFSGRKYYDQAFAKDEKEPFYLFLKHEFLRAQRKDGLIVAENTDNIKLSHFKMLVVGFALGPCKKGSKAKLLERIVNEQQDGQISWTDPEMIDAVNFTVFISTILVSQIEHAFYLSQGKTAPAHGKRITDDEMYKTSTFANIFADFLLAVYGDGASRMDREQFIA
jgi:hypothetical protein